MKIIRHLAAALICLTTLTTPVAAEPRETLGWGRLLNNDFLGDGKDRWRTSSYALSMLRGPEWQGSAPSRFGALLEYRARAEIIAPRGLSGAESADRAYVGAVSLGVHTHWADAGWEATAGVDVVALGPQTGLDSVQDWFHEVIGEPALADTVIANQAADSFHVTARAELAYPISLSPITEFRPFVETQAGVEDLIRVGADLRVGALGNGALDIRDVVTGQRYRSISNNEYGWEFVAGADYALVQDSAYFPGSFGTIAEDSRWRARLGTHWQGGEGVTFFYGATYLSEEYVGQSEGQVVGSMKLNFQF